METKMLDTRVSRVVDSSFHDQVELQAGLSEAVIPAVKGEYYSYSSVFTADKPLYVFMKCRANKSRIIGSAAQLGCEANLFFQFESENHARVYGVKDAQVVGLLGSSVDSNLFDENWISLTGITPADFYALRSRKDPAELMEVCEKQCNLHETSIELEIGVVVAMMTSAGKYGLFLVKELGPTGILIDACHVLM